MKVILGGSHTMLLIAALRDVPMCEPPGVLDRERLFFEQESRHAGEAHRCNSKGVNSKRSRAGKRERWN